MKKSSYYQYEQGHSHFPLSKEFVIAEDDMDDSPKNAGRQIDRSQFRASPDYPQRLREQGFASNRVVLPENREFMRNKDFG